MAISLKDIGTKLKDFFSNINPLREQTITVYGNNNPEKQWAQKTGPGFDQPMQQPGSRTRSIFPNESSSPTPSPTPTAFPSTPPGAYGRNPAISKFNIRPDVHQAIERAAKQYQVPPALLYDMAAQESSFNPNLVNTTQAGIQAGNPTGLFQFTDSTWNDIVNMYNNKPGQSLSLPSTNRSDPFTNAAAAAYLIKMGQLGKWDASENVWGDYWSPSELEKLGFYKQSRYHIPGVRPSTRLGGGE